MMAARSHSISSAVISTHFDRLIKSSTFVEICLVKVVWPRYVHIIQAGYLRLCLAAKRQPTDAPSSTDIAVASEVLEELDFSQSPLRQDLLAEDVGDFLDSDAVSRSIVGSSAVGRLD